MAAHDCHRRPAAVAHSATRRTNASLAALEQIWFELTEKTIHNLDQALDKVAQAVPAAAE